MLLSAPILMYADGGAERLVGQAIKGMARRGFSGQQGVTSERHAARHEGSLQPESSRLRVHEIDLQLHWRGLIPLGRDRRCLSRLW